MRRREKATRMSDELTIQSRPDHLYVISSVPASARSVQEFVEAVVNGTRESGHLKVLVDARQVPSQPTLLERFGYATQLAEELRGLMIAIVASPGLDPERFGETVAQNRGTSLRLFPTLEEACQWLGIEHTGTDAGSAEETESR
jgi:hypothetical protein